MSQADVIREFLVSLGFKTDETSLKKFKSGIEEVSKKVAAMAVAASGAALALGVAVQRFTSNMESLYFAAKRTDSTVKGIKSVQFAARQLGSSSEEAMASIDSLARFMRSSPASGGFIKDTLGVDVNDANGGLRDTSEVLVDILKSLGKMPTYRANGISSILGIDENLTLAARSGDFEKLVKQYTQMTKGTDHEAAAKKAHELQEKLRELQSRFESLVVVVGDKFLKVVGPQLEKFMTWMESHGDGMGESLGRGVEEFIKAVRQIGPEIHRITIIVQDLIDKFESLQSSITKTAETAKNDFVRPFAKVYSWFGSERAKGWLIEDSADQRTASGKIGAKPSGSSRRTGTAGDKVRAAMEFFERNGWTHEQAAGIASNIKNESAFDPSAENQGHYGLAQWDTNRQANFKKWSGKDIRGSSIYDQMRFMHYELTQGAERAAGNALRLTSNPGAASDVMFRMYERAGDATGGRRARDAEQFSQQTNIYVNGSGAADTGRAVAGEQDRVNSRLARNLSGASS